MRIVYIEDMVINAKVIEAYFMRLWHIPIEIYETAEQGIEAIRSDSCDLVLMDVNLPGISGIEAVQQLREDFGSDNLPIFMVSADSDMKTINLSMDVGANGYMTKPVTIEDLRTNLGPYVTTQSH